MPGLLRLLLSNRHSGYSAGEERRTSWYLSSDARHNGLLPRGRRVSGYRALTACPPPGRLTGRDLSFQFSL